MFPSLLVKRTSFSRHVSKTPILRWAHSVQVIGITDAVIPIHKLATVRAGYARNFLVPQGHAVYATPGNREKLLVGDEEIEQEEEEVVSLGKHEEAAAVLLKYLTNKEVKFKRHPVDDDGTVRPVTPKMIKEKLSKQLKIDLDDEQESIQIPDGASDIRKLGRYTTHIALAGEQSVPLQVYVEKR